LLMCTSLEANDFWIEPLKYSYEFILFFVTLSLILISLFFSYFIT